MLGGCRRTFLYLLTYNVFEKISNIVKMADIANEVGYMEVFYVIFIAMIVVGEMTLKNMM